MDALPYTVIRISAGDPVHANSIHTGTGFFYTMAFEGGGVPLIVTNRHVAADKAWLAFDFAEVGDSNERLFGKPNTVTVNKGDIPVVLHPNPDVDLAAIPCHPILEHLVKSGTKPYFLTLSKHNFPPKHIVAALHAASGVLMIGFPNGLMDTENNLPVVRRGTLATHYKADYLGKPNFVVDIAAFGGSSGSPIFAYYESLVPSENGGLGLMAEPSAFLIGVLHSGPVLNAQGKIVPAPVPTNHHIAEVQMPIHLGYALKAPLIEELGAEIQKLL